MKIGFANINLGVRGSSRRLVELANHLLLRGHKVTVYLPEKETCSWLKLETPVKNISEMIEKNDYLIYYGHRELFSLMQEAKVKQRIFYVLGLGNEQVINDMAALDINNGTDIINQKGSPTFYHALHDKEHWKVFANCFNLSDWIQAHLDCKAYTVQGGIDLNTFRRQGKPVAFKIVGSGSRRKAEGTNELLEAIKLAKKSDKRITHQMYAGYGYTQEELARVLSSADVYLDAQKYGGWNNAVAEAMAVGCPTVCTDIMGNRDFCCHEYNCLIVKVDDIKGMANAVIRLLNEPGLRTTIAVNAVVDMKEYTWERASIQMEKALEEL